MPSSRAAQLLRNWAEDEPWKHYDWFAQRNAYIALCKQPLGAMPEDEVRAKVAKLRCE